jgi:RHS repeat-associated protein
VAQLDGSNNVVARFVYGSKPNVPDYMVTSGGTYRILSDHLGSPRAIVDVASGNLIETINFDEFGNETDVLAGTLPTGYVRIPFGFAGGLYDPDTGLVRFGARDYDAGVGRWTSKDPILFQGGQNNIYVYAGNDPIDSTDSDGEDAGDPSGGEPPNQGQCKPDWQCGYAGRVNTGAGVRCGYNCTNGIYFKCVTRLLVLGVGCVPGKLIEGLIETGIVDPDSPNYRDGMCKASK